MNEHTENVSDAALIEFACVLDVEVLRRQFEDDEPEHRQSQQDTIGESGDFDLKNLNEVDRGPGVDVLWDIKNRPT